MTKRPHVEVIHDPSAGPALKDGMIDCTMSRIRGGPRDAEIERLRDLVRRALAHSEQFGDVTAVEMTWRAEARDALK